MPLLLIPLALVKHLLGHPDQRPPNSLRTDLVDAHCSRTVTYCLRRLSPTGNGEGTPALTGAVKRFAQEWFSVVKNLASNFVCPLQHRLAITIAIPSFVTEQFLDVPCEANIIPFMCHYTLANVRLASEDLV